nr:hypothetical protein CFP56_37335 [Quercus suber]
MPLSDPPPLHLAALENLSPEASIERRREWNRGPLRDLFPRIPANSLEDMLDACIAKNFTYDLSASKFYNARRYTSLVVAHVRHNFSDYDKLLRGTTEDVGLERYEARKRTADVVWKVLREWCPWDRSNEVLERCFRVTLLRAEEREPGWDPMDLDSEDEEEITRMHRVVPREIVEDPMDID